jgi:hypothetical protein
MKNSPEATKSSLYGIASLFDDFERKELFKKYLFFLGWIEVLILAACWLYQLGNGSHDQYGPVNFPFPWKTYFLVAFMAPVAITFLVGVVIVGFNKYFGEAQQTVEQAGAQRIEEAPSETSGRLDKLNRMVGWLQKLPFLALLMLLAAAVAFFYNLDVILTFIGTVGEKTIRIVLFFLIGLAAIISVFLLILIILNFQLRKKSMDYQYRSEVAERFGLIILDDKTVLNSEGKLLVDGRSPKKALPLLPGKISDGDPSDRPSAGVVPRHADSETT